MRTGYMLFIQIFGRLWNSQDSYKRELRWGLEQEFNRPFLGTAAMLWNLLRPVQQQRWNQLAISLDLKERSVDTDPVGLESLDYEMTDFVDDVLGQTLLLPAREKSLF